LGQIVAHRQLQVATGSAMSMKPRFNGPYTIEELLPDGSSAIIEHLHTGHIMKAHFSNLKVINYHPAGNRVHANFDNDLQEALEKDTQVDSEDDELTQMLSQRHTLLTRTTRTLGDADWTNDGQNETQARFVDSEGEDLPTDPSEAVLSQNRTDQPPPDQPSPEQSDESDDEDEKEREFNRNKQLQIVASLATLVPLILQHLEDQREMANDLELPDDIPMDMDYELAPPMVVVD
jgi:hypothetical protein